MRESTETVIWYEEHTKTELVIGELCILDMNGTLGYWRYAGCDRKSTSDTHPLWVFVPSNSYGSIMFDRATVRFGGSFPKFIKVGTEVQP